MKKNIVLTALFLLFMTGAQAQYDNLRFGMELSPSFSWLTTDDNKINRSGSNLGLKLRMLTEYNFGENYAFTSGIGFHFNSGGQLQHDNGGIFWVNSDLDPALDTLPAGVNLRYNLQYVEIPLGLKMCTREFGYLRYYLQPALTLGFNSQAKGTIEGRGIGNDAEEIKISRDIIGLNLAWGIGAGVEYALSESTSLVGGLAFQLGFTDMNKDDGTYFDESRNGAARDENSKTKNNSLTITLGILF
ncbi:MAG: outer membrane beta-barrel protein [Saprospiraceae bacterium]|nr:outer membrane beta-barrel protein [Saprospiraceae bacterium]